MGRFSVIRRFHPPLMFAALTTGHQGWHADARCSKLARWKVKRTRHQRRGFAAFDPKRPRAEATVIHSPRRAFRAASFCQFRSIGRPPHTNCLT
jgi:hypothetical protein